LEAFRDKLFKEEEARKAKYIKDQNDELAISKLNDVEVENTKRKDFNEDDFNLENMREFDEIRTRDYTKYEQNKEGYWEKTNNIDTSKHLSDLNKIIDIFDGDKLSDKQAMKLLYDFKENSSKFDVDIAGDRFISDLMAKRSLTLEDYNDFAEGLKTRKITQGSLKKQTIKTDEARMKIITFASQHKLTKKQIKSMLNEPEKYFDMIDMLGRSDVSDDTIQKMIDNRMNVNQQFFTGGKYFDASKKVELKPGAHSVYNVKGADIYQSLDNPTNVNPSMIKQGVDHITKNNKKLGALLQDVKIMLNNADTKAEGVYQSIAKDMGDGAKSYENRIIIPTNKVAKTEQELTERIVKQILSHEVAHKSQRQLGFKVKDSWKAIMDSDLVDNLHNAKNEDFAESVSMLLRNQDKIRNT